MSPAAADDDGQVGLDPIYRTIDVVGDAWSWLVMREAVLYDVRRFSQFQSRLGVARSTLAARLEQLTSGRLLVEHPRPLGPQYHPTDSGLDFLTCLLVAMRWGDRWCADGRAREASAVHLRCGRRLEAVLRCGECHQAVSARDVDASRPGVFAPSTDPRARRRAPDLSLLERTRRSSIARTLGVIGDYWTSLIIREAFFGTRRFDDFQRDLAIAPNILSGRLRRLVGQDILSKVPYGDWPIRHEYRLTERGLDLYPVPLAMLSWGRRWLNSDGPDIQLTHQQCGHDLRAVLSCAHCGEPVVRDDVQVGENA